MGNAHTSGGGAHAIVGILDGFSSDWTTVHGQLVGRRSHLIDHIVVGPPGVFCLTSGVTSSHVVVNERGCLIDGRPLDQFLTARRDAAAVAARLRIATNLDAVVTPVVVMVGARLTIERQPEGLTVVTDEALALWFRSLPVTLTEEECGRLGRAITSQATWGTARTRRSHFRYAPSAPRKAEAGTSSGNGFALFESWARTGTHRFYVHDPDGKCIAYYDVGLGELVVANAGARDFATAMLGPHMMDSPQVRTDATITRSRRP